MSEQIVEAVLWESAENNNVRCKLCNFRCEIKPGHRGICKVRQNLEGRLYSLNARAVCSAAVDPIEKKPLFHFLPGSHAFSIAAVGCNFQCDFCQNWQISQWPRMRQGVPGEMSQPQAIVDAARRSDCGSIAYTYTEPTIFMELAGACGEIARGEGIRNIFVSNGYLTAEALDYAKVWLDGINVDLKAFNDDFYRRHCKASLNPVLDTLGRIANETDIWLEVTTLIIPGENDSADELKQLARFIADELGVDIPWHISRFHPQYNLKEITATSQATLKAAYEIGKNAGLRHIYVGNLPGSGCESTYCHQCGNLLIERTGYQLGQVNLEDGKCPRCQMPLAGKF